MQSSAKQAKTPGISMREEQEEGRGEDCKASEFECDFLAKSQDCLHETNVTSSNTQGRIEKLQRCY